MTRHRVLSLCTALGVAGFLIAPCHTYAENDDRDVRKTIGPFQVSALRQHQLAVTANRHEYEIVLGGTVDMDNSMTRSYGGFEVAFQPNISMEIANTGDVPVVNPRVITNDKRKWWSLDELLQEILARAENDQEKALFIWDFVRKHRHHDSPLFRRDELHDPVKFLCIYGGGLCDDSANVGCSLLFHAGLNRSRFSNDPKTRALHGHVMCEAWLEGDYQFLDIDEDAFYLDRENETLVSGDTLARDHELAKREHTYGPVFRGWSVGEKAAALFGRDDGSGFRSVAGHRIAMTLRPGESVVYRWDNRGKFATDGPRRRRFWGNSMFRYSPRLNGEQFKDPAVSYKDVEPAAPDASGLAGTSKDGHVTYEITSPFVICGGRVHARFTGTNPADACAVELSLDGRKWRQVWRQSEPGTVTCNADLDDVLQVHRRPPKYRYLIRVRLGSASEKSARVSELTFETDVMTSPHFLPRLSLGTNRVAYRDDSDSPHEVRLTYRWQESSNIIPPSAPEKPLFPGPGAVVRRSTFDFQWTPAKSARRYHIQVSRYPDMKLPYRTSFDLIVDRAEHGSPFTGMFSPDTDYFWRVRSQNRYGVWGEWSNVWNFRWDGPRVPVEIKYRTDDSGELTVEWKPNPRGPRPVAYEVHGSDERGFSVSAKPYVVRGLGRRPATLLTETTARELKVVVPKAQHPNQNRCYYRVVAIDQNGTQSGPSDFVELPHPYIHSMPPAKATVGEPYRYQLETLRSLGDLQHRYTQPNQQFWEREEYEFTLDEGPDWLRLDRESDELSGTPRSTDVGLTEISVSARRLYPHEVAPTDEQGAVFQKSASRYQARHVQRFTIDVTAADGSTSLRREALSEKKFVAVTYPALEAGEAQVLVPVKFETGEAETKARPPRGYSIPIVDLNDQHDRQVVVDREKGQYLGHPTTVLLEDNRTMITVYPKGHGRGGIVMKHSHDAGKTWSERLPVPDNWATSKEVPTLHRVVDAAGTKRLIMFSGLYPVRMAVSEDDGNTWTPLKPVGDWGGIVTMGCVIDLKTRPGRYMALFHDDQRFFLKDGQKLPADKKMMTLYKTFSKDGGLTWSFPEAIFARRDVHLCEPGILRSPDGKQLTVLMRENRRQRNSHVIFSNDEGKTWSIPRELPGALTGDRHTGKYAPDGRLFISFRDTCLDSKTHGDWVGWVGTYDDIVQGREGQYRVRIKKNHRGADCAYPGVEVLPDGTFVTTTYGHWTPGESPYILCVRFKLGELDRMIASDR